jgi:hypothetical protein
MIKKTHSKKMVDFGIKDNSTIVSVLTMENTETNTICMNKVRKYLGM